MSIGSNIKKLRREKNITQEQLAEYLGISSRAVSQWECEKTYPDISQIIPLARVFGVTADSILGMDANEDEEVNTAFEKIEQMWCGGYDNQSSDRRNCDLFFREFEVLRELSRKYPMNYEVMLHCVETGNRVMYFLCKTKTLELPADAKKQIYNDILRMITSILEYDKDLGRQIDARANLVMLYSYAGDYDRASAEADKMPDMNKIRTREKYRIATIMEDREERLRLAQKNCANAAMDMIREVFLVGSAYSVMGQPKREEAIKTWKYLAKITEELSDAIPEYRKYSWLKGSYLLLAKEYLRKGECEKVIDCAEKICENNIRCYNCLKENKAEYSYISGEFGKCDSIDFSKLKEEFKWDLVGCYDEADDKTGNPVVTSPRFQELVKKIEETIE